MGLVLKAALLSPLLSLQYAHAQEPIQNKVLVIHSYSLELSWSQQVKQGIDQGFANSDRSVQVFHEYLDGKKFPQIKHHDAFWETIRQKYEGVSIDTLMVADDPGLELLLEVHEQYFPTTPVVFLGINNPRPELFQNPWLTGVFETHSLAETVLEAKQQTGTDALIVINDSSATGIANIARIEALKQLSNGPSRIEVITDLAPSEIESRVGPFPDTWPVLSVGQMRRSDDQSALIGFEEETQLLRASISNPMYTETLVRFGHGTVGGKVLDGVEHGKQAVQLVEQVLSGTPPSQIEPILKADNRWLFDDRELKRFNLKSEKLPEGSEIRYATPSFYEKYKSLVWLVLASFGGIIAINFVLIEGLRRQRAAKKLLAENEQRYREFAEVGANLFWELDSSLVVQFVSGGLCFVPGVSPEEIVGQSPQALVGGDPNIEIDWAELRHLTLDRQPIRDFIFRYRQDNEEVSIFQLSANPIFDQRGEFLGYRGIEREITQEYNLSQTIAYQATYDALTGLFNRYTFDERLGDAVEDTKAHGTEYVLCYLDLDRFKIINDTVGHLAGDQLLSEVALVLKREIQSQDILGRLGGDEFGLLLRDCQIEKATDVCERIVDAIASHRLQWGDRCFEVGVSIGVVPFSKTFGSTVTDLLMRADLACYQAKNEGRGRTYIAEYGNDEVQRYQTQMTHVAAISQAIEANRFYLVKQPIQLIEDAADAPNHYEILLRLKDAQGNVISPGHFIPAAELYGVISTIDRWVVAEAFKQYERCFSEENAKISINLSGSSINDPRVTEYIIDQISASSIDPNCLCFEITETAAIAQVDEAQHFIQTLQELGVSFALDDFGTGVSSLSYLKSLPVDYLKIDGSLVKSIATDSSDLAIVRLINDLAHMMGMKTIAEFVEDQDILGCLRQIGVDYAQGYGICRPIPLDKPFNGSD